LSKVLFNLATRLRPTLIFILRALLIAQAHRKVIDVNVLDKLHEKVNEVDNVFLQVGSPNKLKD
jgi:hypothetical protein